VGAVAAEGELVSENWSARGLRLQVARQSFLEGIIMTGKYLQYTGQGRFWVPTCLRNIFPEHCVALLPLLIVIYMMLDIFKSLM